MSQQGFQLAGVLNTLLSLFLLRSGGHSIIDCRPDLQHSGVCHIELLLTISSPVMALFFGAGLVSSIGRGFAKLRRNSEGKNNLTSGSNYSLANESELAPHSQSLSVTTHQGELSLPPAPPSATPVVMRKRKMSGEDVMPFSATKRWVGLWL